MATPKSPFLVIQEFLSGKQCEQIVDALDFLEPDVNTEGKPIKMSRHHDESEELIFDRVEQVIPQVEEHYQCAYRGTERMLFEYYADGTISEPLCENSNWVRKKWVRTKDRDLSGILFLCDYQEQVPFDSDYEVYGGKFEFPQHGFGFNPQRGTLVIYPSGPHFINATAEILAGDLCQVRFHMATAMPYLYDPGLFPGDFRTWFKGI